MKCEEYRELFSDVIDGELSEEQAKDFRDHLRNCEACREELEKFRRAQSLLKLLPKKEAPPELWEAIAAEVEPAEQRLVFLVQSVGTLQRIRFREKPSPPTHTYGISFRNLRR